MLLLAALRRARAAADFGRRQLLAPAAMLDATTSCGQQQTTSALARARSLHLAVRMASSSAAAAAALEFTVRRQPAVLVAPAGPTPRELKKLSDIDDQSGLRFQVPVVHFFRLGHRQRHEDPAAVLREAVAKALVHYYPFAGRLRELEGRKLAVDCTGEGVLFVEADADVRLDHFGDALQPPFPGIDELLFDVPGSDALLDAPLLLFQVTRLACGGFVFGVRMQHAMADGAGLVQLLRAIAELARGAAAPELLPVWGRDLLEALPRDDSSPRSSALVHREYDDMAPDGGNGTAAVSLDDMAHRSFFFGPREVAALRSHLPPDLHSRATTFDLLTGCLWKCRTAALSPAPGEEMRMLCIVNLRGRRHVGSIPRGYYGNAFAFAVAIATADNLGANPVGYAVELVRKAKRRVDMEYMRSVAALMVRRGRPQFSVANAYLVSDVSKSGFLDLDFGWGTPVYAGPAKAGIGVIPGFASFLIKFKNASGEDGVLVPVCLPSTAVMDKFVEEMSELLRPADNVDVDTSDLLDEVSPLITVAL